MESATPQAVHHPSSSSNENPRYVAVRTMAVCETWYKPLSSSSYRARAREGAGMMGICMPDLKATT
jgi:hypothetical protein